VGARWSVARLRHQTCFALAAVTTALTTRRAALHTRPCKKLPGSRQPLCEALDRPALRPWPEQPEAYAAWTQARVHIDSHVEVEGHDSAVPDALIQQPLDVRLRAHVVDLFPKGTRVASHHRAPYKGRHSTGAEPMPPAHRHDAAWTPQRLLRWAAPRGPAVAQVVETLRAARPPPQQGCRAC
jgi:hypothetical protein